MRGTTAVSVFVHRLDLALPGAWEVVVVILKIASAEYPSQFLQKLTASPIREVALEKAQYSTCSGETESPEAQESSKREVTAFSASLLRPDSQHPPKPRPVLVCTDVKFHPDWFFPFFLKHTYKNKPLKGQRSTILRTQSPDSAEEEQKNSFIPC